jgi:hypothetical protein
MLIHCDFISLATAISVVQQHANTTFSLSGLQANYFENELKEELAKFFEPLKSDLWVCVESPYVDRIYRDSYYHYYAGKLGSYVKDCIRLSFFTGPIAADDFQQENRRAYLQAEYVGFLVIRPTLQSVIGRNILSPSALREPGIEVCRATYSVTANAIKLTVSGFPHSSQDVETMTCAQTTLWSIMDYFSQRYADYRPALPSLITKRLEALSVERQMPATGLSVDQISFALKGFGFGPRIYHRKTFGSEFDDLLSCYVESGIPIVVALHNEHIGHAALCIGHEPVEKETLVKLLNSQDIETEFGSIQLMDLDRLPKKFVFIDDNLPPYARATLAHPAINYTYSDWESCEITACVVPLYKKVYLEAYEAKQLVKGLLASGRLQIQADTNVLLRFFLASSRSYKDYIATDPLMQSTLKQSILATALPKFIWVGELTNAVAYLQNQATGVVLLDATEADTQNFKPVIIAAFGEKIINFAAQNDDDQVYTESIHPFLMYQNNLS